MGEGEKHTYLGTTSRFFVQMLLMDDEMVCKNIVVDPREIHFEEAGRLVSSVANKAFFAPNGYFVNTTHTHVKGSERTTDQGGPAFLKITYGSYAD